MADHDHSKYISRQRAFWLIAAIIAAIYANSIHATWHLDDYPNIVYNDKLHLQNLGFHQLSQTFFAAPTGKQKLYRPIACLSFALNWYLNGDKVLGYHLVNISIHIVTAFLLLLVIGKLFQTPVLKKNGPADVYFIALLTAVLWAVHPIQTQAVTYIVQRMAQLAALFYLLGMWAYLSGRLNQRRSRRNFFFFLCLIALLCAIGAKENAAMMPMALLLLEIVFFQPLEDARRRRNAVFAVCILACVLFIGGFYLLLNGPSLDFLNGYSIRPFTLTERLLTEPRVLVMYLTQIFAPSPDEFSLVHDFTISSSLLTPWTTLPAIFFVLGTVILAIAQIRRHPIFAFCVLFFFINHLIESTFIPLELVFEHRNYLPSLFIFLPIVTALANFIRRQQQENKRMWITTVPLVIGIVTLWGYTTYTRNAVWATAESMLKDTVIKAPKSPRAYQGLAKLLADRGDYHRALNLYQAALTMEGQRPDQAKVLSYNNIGNIYLNLGKLDLAAQYYADALAIFPKHQKAHYNLALAQLKIGHMEAALTTMNKLLRLEPRHEEYLNTKGLILINIGRYKAAASTLGKALRLSPHHKNILLHLGFAYMHLGNFRKANLFFSQAAKIAPLDMTLLLCRIESSYRNGENLRLKRCMTQLFKYYTLQQISTRLKKIPNDRMSVPLSQAILSAAIDKRIETVFLDPLQQ